MSTKLKTAEGTFSGINQLVSDSMEFVTAELSKSEKEVLESDRNLNEQKENVKSQQEAYSKAQVVCLEYLTEVKKAEEDLSDAKEKQTSAHAVANAVKISPLAMPPARSIGEGIITAIGLTVFNYFTGEVMKGNTDDVAEACAERYESVSETFEKYQKHLEESKAAFEEAKKKMSEDSETSHASHLHKESLAALQKYIFSVGERIKNANLLVAKLSSQAGTAEFMVEVGTMEELDMELNEMQENLECFQKIVPALSFQD